MEALYQIGSGTITNMKFPELDRSIRINHKVDAQMKPIIPT